MKTQRMVVYLMKFYKYIAENQLNKSRIKGKITGDSKSMIEEELKKQGLKIILTEELSDYFHIRTFFYTLSTRITKKELCYFLDELAFMLDTNLSLPNALKLKRDSIGGRKKQKLIAKPLVDEVEQGKSLHIALEKSGYFDDATVQQIKSGEEAGNVPEALKRVVKQIQREISFKKNIKNAMTYPILICVVMTIVLWVLMTLVVPSLAKTLIGLGGELPLITKVVIGTSEFISKSTPFFIVLIIAVAVAYKILIKQTHIKYAVDFYRLKIPIIGSILIKIEMSRFCKCLAAMQRSSISTVQSLLITKSVVKNKYLQSLVSKASKMVEISGMSLAIALNEVGGFPPIMIQQIEIGVNSGNVATVLETIADRFEDEVDDNIKRVTSLAEPVMIVLVGLIAGTVVVSIFLPMFSLIDVL